MQFEFKTREENYEDTLAEARQMTTVELQEVLRDSQAYHSWATLAYKKALDEKVQKILFKA